jgi:Zn ribbon nucleic-acid-binding protein
MNENKQNEEINGCTVKPPVILPAISNLEGYVGDFDGAIEKPLYSHAEGIFINGINPDPAHHADRELLTNRYGSKGVITEVSNDNLPDHDSKYDKNIAEANEKLKTLSNLADPVDKPVGYLGKLGDAGITKKNGMIIHRRTSSDYRKLWDWFMKNEADNYCATMGYSVEVIKMIGYKKFIDIHDWSTIEDIKKWKTDAVHIIPCIHCGAEFTTYEMDLGLCDHCKPHYNLKRFGEMCAANEEVEPGISYGLRTAFVYRPEFREMYLKKCFCTTPYTEQI